MQKNKYHASDRLGIDASQNPRTERDCIETARNQSLASPLSALIVDALSTGVRKRHGSKLWLPVLVGDCPSVKLQLALLHLNQINLGIV